jgi:hypothetical protein
MKSYRLGAVLAYNLNRLNTKERGREKLLQLIREIPPRSILMLCFGEIDCRCHLLKQADKKRISIDTVVKDCVNCYFEVVDELIQSGFKIFIWNAMPTADSFNIEYPVYGSHLERNKCTMLFNDQLKVQCEKRGLVFVSIFRKLITKNFKTRTIYFFDSIHLGQLAMPYFIKEIKIHLPHFNLGWYNNLLWDVKRVFSPAVFFLKQLKRTVALVKIGKRAFGR